MRSWSIAVLRFFTLVAIALVAPGVHAETGAAAASSTLDQMHAAAAKADGAAYFALFAPDAVFIGADASERWPLAAFRQYATARFAAGQGWTYRSRERHVTIAPIVCGCVAWFDELLDNVHYGTSRGSGVLIKTDQGWKIEQYVLTFPVPNALAAGITNQIKEFETVRPR